MLAQTISKLIFFFFSPLELQPGEHPKTAFVLRSSLTSVHIISCGYWEQLRLSLTSSQSTTEAFRELNSKVHYGCPNQLSPV